MRSAGGATGHRVKLVERPHAPYTVLCVSLPVSPSRFFSSRLPLVLCKTRAALPRRVVKQNSARHRYIICNIRAVRVRFILGYSLYTVYLLYMYVFLTNGLGFDGLVSATRSRLAFDGDRRKKQ